MAYQTCLNGTFSRTEHGGSVKVVASDVPVSLSASIRIEDAEAELDFDLPEAVVRAFKKES